MIPLLSLLLGYWVERYLIGPPEVTRYPIIGDGIWVLGILTGFVCSVLALKRKSVLSRRCGMVGLLLNVGSVVLMGVIMPGTLMFNKERSRQWIEPLGASPEAVMADLNRVQVKWRPHEVQSLSALLADIQREIAIQLPVNRQVTLETSSNVIVGHVDEAFDPAGFGDLFAANHTNGYSSGGGTSLIGGGPIRVTVRDALYFFAEINGLNVIVFKGERRVVLTQDPPPENGIKFYPTQE